MTGLRRQIIGWSDGLIRKEPWSVANEQQLSPFWSLNFILFGLLHALCLVLGANILSRVRYRQLPSYFWTKAFVFGLLLELLIAVRNRMSRYGRQPGFFWTYDVVMCCFCLTLTLCLFPAPNRITAFFNNAVVFSTFLAWYYMCDIPLGVILLLAFLLIILLYQTILTMRCIGVRSNLLSN